MRTRLILCLLTLLLTPMIVLGGDAPVNIDFLSLTADCTLTQNGAQYFCKNEVKDLSTGEVIMAGGISSQVGMKGSAKAQITVHEGTRTLIITTMVEADKADVQLRIMDGDKELKRIQTTLSLTEDSK